MKRRKTVKGSQVSSSAYTDGTRRGRCMTARRMPACRKCGAMAWEHAYDDWYCFRCGNRGYWHGAGAEREFVQGGVHGA